MCSTFQTCILNLHYLHRLRCINEDAYFQNHVQLLRHTASDPQHLSISLTANSAITGGVLGTDRPGLLQCDVGRHGKQSTQHTAVCDECCCTARKCDHIMLLLQDLHRLHVPQRIEFKLAVLAFRCLHGMALPYYA